jgi:hypothetical protein
MLLDGVVICVYLMTTGSSINQIFNNKGEIKMSKNNINIVYNTLSLQDKINEYLINKTSELMPSNTEIICQTRCESRFQGILDIRKPGYYYVSEFYLSQHLY